MSSSPTEPARLVEVTLPDLGADALEAIIVAWDRHPGDWVERDEPICVVGTGGMRAAVASSASGRLVRLLAGVGTRVEPGASLAEIETGVAEQGDDDRGSPSPIHGSAASQSPHIPAAEAPSTASPYSAEIEPEPVAEEEPVAEGPVEPEPVAQDPEPLAEEEPAAEARFDPLADPEPPPRLEPEPVEMANFHSPAVKRLAAEHGLDLSTVPARGASGRIRAEDVLAYLASECEPTSR